MEGSYRTNSQFGNSYIDPDDNGDVYYDANDQNRTDILKLILYDLNSAIAPREIRLMAVHAALEEFDHDDEVLHDEELDLRADHILLQKLTYAMCIDPGSVEVGYICSALEAVYRAGRTRLAQSFHEICDALLPLFVEMIRPPKGAILPGQRGSDGAGSVEGESVGESRNNAVSPEHVLERPSSPRSRPSMDHGEGGGDHPNMIPPDDHMHQQNQHAEFFMEECDSVPGAAGYTYGDFDEESAESVEIPSGGAGEYFDQMNRMSGMTMETEADHHGLGAGSIPGPASVNRTTSEAGGPAPSETDDKTIPPGVGEYLEEMKRRTSADNSASAGMPEGGFYANQGAAGGGQQMNDNTLVPHAPAVGEHALVLRTGDAPPPPTGNPSSSSQPPQSQGPGGGDTERIRMELNAAKEAMQNSGQGKRLPIESDTPPVYTSQQLTTAVGGSNMPPPLPPSQENQLALQGATDVEDDGAPMGLRGGGMEDIEDDDDDDEVNGESKHEEDDQFDSSNVDQSEFNGSIADSQDNPFSDTSSFKNYGGSVRSSYSGTAYSESKASGEAPMDDQDNPFSDTSSFQHVGNSGASVGAFSGAAMSESRAGGRNNLGNDGGEEDTQDNPFSESSSFQNFGGSSVGGYSESRSHGARSTLSFKSSVGPEGGPTGSTSQGASEFDEHGGFVGAAPEIFAGHDDSNYGGSSVGGYSESRSHGARSFAPSFKSSVGPGGATGSISGQGYNDEDTAVEHEGDAASFRNPGGASVGGFSERSRGSGVGMGTNESLPPNQDDPAGPPDHNDNPGFDEQGGYSGATPEIFTGYNDEGGDESYAERKSRDYADQSQRSYADRSAPSYGGSGSEYYRGAEQDEQSGYSSAPGFEGVNRHTSNHPVSDANPSNRRQSELTDDWDESDRHSQFNEEKSNNMYMPGQSSSGMGMMPGQENNPPHPEYYPPQPNPDGQYQIDDEQESKYSEYAYENNPHGVMQDEDIFQFKEPQLPMTSQDYFNYNEPVEGEICPLAVRKVLKIMRYFSRVLSAMEPLAQHSGLVDALLYHMTKKPHSVDYEDEITSRVDAIAVVVNLACAEENKIMLVYHPGLLDAIINIANHDPIDEAREHAAIVLMNLVSYDNPLEIYQISSRW